MRKLAALAVVALCLPGAMCQTTNSLTYPDREDVEAIAKPKPKPPLEIAADPEASDRYQAAVQHYADEVGKAGKRVCRFLKRTGMTVDCSD